MRKIGKQWICVLGIAGCTFSCKSKVEPLSKEDSVKVVKDVSATADHIAGDVSTKGPVAWLDYFEDKPGFFMASGGALPIKDFTMGKKYLLDTVAYNFQKVSLTWFGYRVDPLTDRYAAFGAYFHENITLVVKREFSVAGYVTAIMHFDGKKWKIRNMNWSLVPAADAK